MTGRWRAGRARSALLTVALHGALVVVAIALWGWGVDAGRLDPFTFSRPGDVWGRIERWVGDGSLVEHARSTLWILGLGWGAGVLAGTVLGAVMGGVRWVRQYAEPFLVFANAMPRLLLLPFLVVWLGFGYLPKVVLVVAVVLVPVAISVANGVRAVDPDLIRNLRTMGASRVALGYEVYAPFVAVWVLASCRTTVGYAFQAAVAAEFIGSSVGLGALVARGQIMLDASQVYAALAVMAVIGVLIDIALSGVERRVTRWMP